MAASPQTNSSAVGLPAWAQHLSEKYFSRTFALFVISGNVHDLVPVQKNGAVEFQPLPAFLNESLFGRRDIVISYDRGGGLAFGKPEMQADFRRALEGYDTFHGTKYAQGLPRNPDGILGLLESYLRVR